MISFSFDGMKYDVACVLSREIYPEAGLSLCFSFSLEMLSPFG